MRTRGLGVFLVLLLILAGCQDAAGPIYGPEGTPQPQFDGVAGNSSDDGDDDDDDDEDSDQAGSSDEDYRTILQQSPDAPRLETYQVSFWVSRRKATTVTVNYLPAAGQSEGEPFLYFSVPRDALQAAGGGARIERRDSLLITMTIDPVNFDVTFQPSGVLFSKKKPAILVFWYQHADPDLNRDGAVDAADHALAEQLRIVYRRNRNAHWHQTESMQSWIWPYVYTSVRHFSAYAVSW